MPRPRFARRSPQPPVGSGDANGLLMLTTKPQFGSPKQPVDDVVVLPHPIIDELAVAFGSDHEQRRCFALRNPAWHLDIDLGAIIKGGDWPPRRIVAGDDIAEAQFRNIDAGVNG